MEILGRKIRAGNVTRIEIDVASLYTRTKIEVPVIVSRSSKPGPTLLVLGGVHGNEVNGVEILRRLVFTKEIKPEYGTVIAVPIVNVMAFLNMERKFADGRDLNRSFPGRKGGSLASKLAHSVTSKLVSHADYVIDLHSGADDRFNFPQVRYDESHEESLRLAEAFSAPFTILKGNPPRGTLRRYLNSQDIPVAIFEGGKSKHVDEDVVLAGLTGVKNVMKYLGLVSGKPELRDSIHISKSRWIRAQHSGMFQPVARNGEEVSKGDLLGFVNGPYAQFQRKVSSPMSGHIFCVNEAPVVYKGEALFHIGRGE